MKKTLEQHIDQILNSGASDSLSKIGRGIEKESLRVDSDGHLSQLIHPDALGAPLTHSAITTDFSESLLELVTPVFTDVDKLLKHLFHIHQFVCDRIGEERLWVNSMPCDLDNTPIPIAQFGKTNIAQMKQIYRRGLSYRYGSKMQAIAGIHYNFSLPDEFWHKLHQREGIELQTIKSNEFFGALRNFNRLSWLVCYLFGASPVMDKSFSNQTIPNMKKFLHRSLCLPYGTSLRQSKIGYSNHFQADINVDYENLPSFLDALQSAMTNSVAQYRQIGVKVDGTYRQLNASLLQIANEFYADIRPKRVCNRGESPLEALFERGVEYLEVRNIDLNPYCPTGIDDQTVMFLDIFLLYCLWSESPLLDSKSQQDSKENKQRAVELGRSSGFNIIWKGQETSFKPLALSLLQEMELIAILMDSSLGGDNYKRCLANQKDKILYPEQTLSGKIIEQMMSEKSEFLAFGNNLATIHQKTIQERELPNDILQQFVLEVERSKNELQALEASTNIDFDQFLQQYFAQQHQLKGRLKV